MASSKTAAAATAVDYFFELARLSDLHPHNNINSVSQHTANSLPTHSILPFSLVANMHSIRTLLLFASTCLVQAQTSASRNARDIFPTLTTTSISIPFPSITLRAIADQHDPSDNTRDIFPTLTTTSISMPFPSITPRAIPDQHDLLFSRDNEPPHCDRFDDTTLEDLQRQSEEASTPASWTRVFHSRTAVIEGARRLGEAQNGRYDPDFCTQACNAVPECTGINVYFEATLNLTGLECPLVKTIAKCTFWGEPLSVEMTTDFVHKEHLAVVLFAGSNAYRRGSPTESDEETDEESSANGCASTRLAGLTVASVMVLWVLRAMTESWF